MKSERLQELSNGYFVAAIFAFLLAAFFAVQGPAVLALGAVLVAVTFLAGAISCCVLAELWAEERHVSRRETGTGDACCGGRC